MTTWRWGWYFRYSEPRVPDGTVWGKPTSKLDATVARADIGEPVTRFAVAESQKMAEADEMGDSMLTRDVQTV